MAGGLRRATVAFAGALTAQRGKVTGQLDVLAYREEWQQVELLEDVAGVVDAEMVAARGGQLFQVLAEQADAAAAGLLHAAEEAEQGEVSQKLLGLQHAVLGCGSTVYETFQNCPRLHDKCLGENGSRRLAQRAELLSQVEGVRAVEQDGEDRLRRARVLDHLPQRRARVRGRGRVIHQLLACALALGAKP